MGFAAAQGLGLSQALTAVFHRDTGIESQSDDGEEHHEQKLHETMSYTAHAMIIQGAYLLALLQYSAPLPDSRPERVVTKRASLWYLADPLSQAVSEI